MAFCWRLRDIPEIQPLTRAERTEVWAATAGRRMRDPLLLLLMVPYFLIVAVGNFVGGLVIPWRFGGAVGGGLGAGLAIALLLVVTYRRCRPHLAAEVRRRKQRGSRP